eukprot:COSAG01_NODE_1918_length_8905_cov_2.532591_1_plen_281_part_00
MRFRACVGVDVMRGCGHSHGHTATVASSSIAAAGCMMSSPRAASHGGAAREAMADFFEDPFDVKLGAGALAISGGAGLVAIGPRQQSPPPPPRRMALPQVSLSHAVGALQLHCEVRYPGADPEYIAGLCDTLWHAEQPRGGGGAEHKEQAGAQDSLDLVVRGPIQRHRHPTTHSPEPAAGWLHGAGFLPRGAEGRRRGAAGRGRGGVRPVSAGGSGCRGVRGGVSGIIIVGRVAATRREATAEHTCAAGGSHGELREHREQLGAAGGQPRRKQLGLVATG